VKHSSDILLHFVDRQHREDPATQLETCLSILDQGFRFTVQKLATALAGKGWKPDELPTLITFDESADL
jgi:hypothetical protein